MGKLNYVEVDHVLCIFSKLWIINSVIALNENKVCAVTGDLLKHTQATFGLPLVQSGLPPRRCEHY